MSSYAAIPERRGFRSISSDSSTRRVCQVNRARNFLSSLRVPSRVPRIVIAVIAVSLASLAFTYVFPSTGLFRSRADIPLVPRIPGPFTRLGRPNTEAEHQEALEAAALSRPPFSAYFTSDEIPLLEQFHREDGASSPLHDLFGTSPMSHASLYPSYHTVQKRSADSPVQIHPYSSVYQPFAAERLDAGNPTCTRRGQVVHATPSINYPVVLPTQPSVNGPVVCPKQCDHYPYKSWPACKQLPRDGCVYKYCKWRNMEYDCDPDTSKTKPTTAPTSAPTPPPTPPPAVCPEKCLGKLTGSRALSACKELPHCEVVSCDLFHSKCTKRKDWQSPVHIAIDLSSPGQYDTSTSNGWPLSPLATDEQVRLFSGRIMKPVQSHPNAAPLAEVATPQSLRLPDLSAIPPVWTGDVCRFDRLELEDFTVGMSAKYTIDLSGPPEATDVFYLIDGSLSMARAIDAIKAQGNALLDLFGKRPNVHYGLGVFRDEREDNLGLALRTPLTRSRKTMLRKFKEMVPAGGLDPDDSNLVSLYRVANDTEKIGWRVHSRKYIIMIADRPGHEPSCPKWYRMTRTVVGNLLLKKQMTMVVVNVGPPSGGTDALPYPYRCRPAGWEVTPGQGSDLAKKTFGASFSVTNLGDMASTIKTQIHAIPARIMVATDYCDAGFNSTLSVPQPMIVPQNGPRVMSNTIRIKPSVCGNTVDNDGMENTFRCFFTFFDFGGTIGSLRTRAIKVKGCPKIQPV